MRPLLLVLALAGCAGVRVPERESRAAPARAADDRALEDSAADLATFEDHFVAVAGGRFLGGAQLREDAANLLAGAPGADAHAYLFAGNGLLAALGLKSAFDPATGELTLTSGDRRRAFTSADGSAVAWFTVEPASGLGVPVDVEFVVASGFAGTALVAGVDADAAGLVLSEIPGVAQVTELMTGRVVSCRRALARVTLVGFDGEPDARVSALVEVLFPK